MSSSFTVINNTTFQLVGKLITMTSTIILTILITRNYGVEGYGAYSLMFSIPALFYIISDFGINASAAKILTINEGLMGRYIGNVALLRSTLSLALMLFGTALLIFMPYSNYIKFGIILGYFTILTTSLISTANIAFQVKFRYDLAAIAQSLGNIAWLMTSLLLIYYKSPTVFIVGANVLASFLAFYISIYFMKKISVIPVFEFDRELIKGLLYSSLPIGLMFVFSQINFKADSILLSVLKLPLGFGYTNTETVGIYGLPYKIFEISLVLPLFFMNAFYPLMVKKYTLGKDQLAKVFKKALLGLFFLGLASGAVGFIFSDLAIFILGGEGFSNSVGILKIFMTFLFIFYLTQPLSWLIIVLKGEKLLPPIYFVAAFFNVTSNVFLIPKYSYLASVNITWISELIILVLLALTARRLWVRV